MDDDSGAIKFVYTWSLIIFITMLLYGTYLLFRKKSVVGLNFLQYFVLMLVIIPQGVITTDNRELETSVTGWYILLIYWFYSQALLCPIFITILGIEYAFEELFSCWKAKTVEEDEHNGYCPAEGYHPAVFFSKSDSDESTPQKTCLQLFPH